MDVDMLKSAGQSLVITKDPLAEHRPEPKKKMNQEVAAEVKKDKPDVTIRSGKFKAALSSVRVRKQAPAMPEITSKNKTKVEFDVETDQFRVVKKTIESANRRMIGANSMFQYSIHEKTNQIMIRVIDKETKELILEIPPEKALDAIAKMWELAGIFVDEKR